MAYQVGDRTVTVTGANTGGEIWSNTWCVESAGAATDQAIADVFNAFYEDVGGFASWLSTSWNASRCVVRTLTTGLPFEAAWTTRSGSSTASRLPNQLAMRVSLSSGLARGGPFLTGFVVTAVDTDSHIEPALITDFIGALETLTGSLTALGVTLALHQPTTDVVTPVTEGRIGSRFDIIRKRANDIADSYTTFDVA